MLVTSVSLVYLVEDEFNPCVLWPLMIEIMVVLLVFLSLGKYGFTNRGLMLF